MDELRLQETTWVARGHRGIRSDSAGSRLRLQLMEMVEILRTVPKFQCRSRNTKVFGQAASPSLKGKRSNPTLPTV